MGISRRKDGRRKGRERDLLGKLHEPSFYKHCRRLGGENWAPRRPLGS